MKKISLFLVLCLWAFIIKAQWNACLGDPYFYSGGTNSSGPMSMEFVGCTGYVTYYDANTTELQLLKTVDCGDTWQPLFYSEREIETMHFVDESMGYAMDANDTLIKTMDGGLTWDVLYGFDVLPGEHTYLKQFLDENTGYAEVNRYNIDSLVVTYDGGLSWQSIFNDLNIIEADFLNVAEGLVYSSNNMGEHKLWITADSGITWTEKSLNTIFSYALEEVRIGALQYVSENIIYGTASIYDLQKLIFFKSNDGGNTWEISEVSNTLNDIADWSLDLDFLNEDHGYVMNSVTYDGGISWASSWNIGDSLVDVEIIGEDSVFLKGLWTLYRSFGQPNGTQQGAVNFIEVSNTSNAENGNYCDAPDTALFSLFAITTGYEEGHVFNFDVAVGTGDTISTAGTVDNNGELHFDDLEYIYENSGSYNVTYFVTDAEGNFAYIYNPSDVVFGEGCNVPEVEDEIFAADTIYGSPYALYCDASDSIYFFITVYQPNFVQDEEYNFEIHFGDGSSLIGYEYADTMYSSLTFEAVHSYDIEGSYNVTYIITDPDGVSDTMFVENEVVFGLGCDSVVWPGDANFDGVADVNDILPIGIANNMNGPERLNATTNWQAEPFFIWNESFVTGVNYAHADCDGNGLIDTNDIDVVDLNYGLIHNKNEDDNDAELTDPDIYFNVDVDIDTSFAGSLIQVPVMLGTQGVQVEDVYGVVFTVNFNPDYVEEISVDYTNSWLGTLGLDLAYLDKTFIEEGVVDVGMVRTNQQNISGYGEIATLDILTSDDLSGKNNEVYAALNLSFSNVRVISFDENEIPVNTNDAEIVLAEISTGIQRSMEKIDVGIYPNPTKEWLHLSFSAEGVYSVSVTDMFGKEIFRETTTALNHKLNMSHYAKGIYTLTISDGKTVQIEKVLVK